MSEWHDIATAPKDGSAFMIWQPGYEWPEVVRWHDYDSELRDETGEDGYFAYAETLLADVCDPIDMGEHTHWSAIVLPVSLPKDERA